MLHLDEMKMAVTQVSNIVSDTVSLTEFPDGIRSSLQDKAPCNTTQTAQGRRDMSSDKELKGLTRTPDARVNLAIALQGNWKPAQSDILQNTVDAFHS